MREKINPFANRKMRFAKLGKYTKFTRPAEKVTYKQAKRQNQRDWRL